MSIKSIDFTKTAQKSLYTKNVWRAPVTLTLYGNAQISTAQSVSSGSSLLLDGTGDYITVASSSLFQFGTGEFTIEGWYYYNGINVHYLWDMRSASSQATVAMYYSAPSLVYYVSGAARITGTANLTTGQWYHIAVSKSGNSTRMFLNGVQIGSTYTDNVSYLQPVNIYVGGFWQTPTTNNFNGYIDCLRITKGVGLYTTNFTPQTYLRNSANTVLMCEFAGTNGATTTTEYVY